MTSDTLKIHHYHPQSVWEKWNKPQISSSRHNVTNCHVLTTLIQQYESLLLLTVSLQLTLHPIHLARPQLLLHLFGLQCWLHAWPSFCIDHLKPHKVQGIYKKTKLSDATMLVKPGVSESQSAWYKAPQNFYKCDAAQCFLTWFQFFLDPAGSFFHLLTRRTQALQMSPQRTSPSLQGQKSDTSWALLRYRQTTCSTRDLSLL